MALSVVGSAWRLPAWGVLNLSENQRQFRSGIYHPVLLESRAELHLDHQNHHRLTASAHSQNHQQLRSRPFRRPLARSLIYCSCSCCSSSSSPSSVSVKRSGVVVGKVSVDAKDHDDEDKDDDNAEKEPLFLRVAVSGLTQLLRAFSRTDDRSSKSSGRGNTSSSSSETRSGTNSRSQSYFSSSSRSLLSSPPIPVPVEAKLELDVEDWSTVGRSLVDTLREDYARSYFLSGEFTDALYSESCYFADPTVQFSGRDLYKRNLKLLVPFYEDPSLTLDDIGEVVDGESKLILASWRLRVYLKLPWKPFVAVDGSTRYSLGADAKIIKHVETWNVTGIQAIGQLFRPSERAFWKRGSKGRTSSRP